MSLEDAVGPNFKDVFKIAVKSIGYRKVPVFFWFPRYENNAEFVKKGYFNILWIFSKNLYRIFNTIQNELS